MKGSSCGTPDHSEDPGPDAAAEELGCDSLPHHYHICLNYLASGTSPLTSLPSDNLGGGDDDDDPAASDIVYGGAVYGPRDNVAACERAGMIPDILHRIDATARGKRLGDA